MTKLTFLERERRELIEISSSSGAGLLAWKGGHLRSLLMGRPTPSRT